jgi:hypothetical protein
VFAVAIELGGASLGGFLAVGAAVFTPGTVFGNVALAELVRTLLVAGHDHLCGGGINIQSTIAERERATIRAFGRHGLAAARECGATSRRSPSQEHIDRAGASV